MKESSNYRRSVSVLEHASYFWCLPTLSHVRLAKHVPRTWWCNKVNERGLQERAHPDLNQGPADLQSAALATELCTHALWCAAVGFYVHESEVS